MLLHQISAQVPFRNLLGSFGTTLAVTGLNAVTGLFLARGLGVSPRGELAAAILWPALLTLLGTLTISESVTYYVARGEIPLPTIVGTVLVATAVQTVVIVGAGLLIVPLVLDRYGGGVVTSSLIYLGTVLPYLLVGYGMCVLQGLHRFRSYQALRLLIVVASAAGLGAAYALSSLSVRHAVAVYVAAWALAACATVAAVAREPLRDIRFDRNVARLLLTFGLRSHVSAISSQLNERLDQLIISLILSSTKLGLYAVAATLSSGAVVIGVSIQLIAVPAIARLPDGPERASLAKRLVRMTFLSSAPIVVVFVVFTPQLLRWLFGPQFVAATAAARILFVAALMLSTGYVLTGVLKALGRPFEASKVQFVGVVVSVVSLGSLLPFFGIVGAGVASVLAYTVTTIWMARSAARHLGVSAMTFFVPTRRPSTAWTTSGRRP